MQSVDGLLELPVTSNKLHNVHVCFFFAVGIVCLFVFCCDALHAYRKAYGPETWPAPFVGRPTTLLRRCCVVKTMVGGWLCVTTYVALCHHLCSSVSPLSCGSASSAAKKLWVLGIVAAIRNASSFDCPPLFFLLREPRCLTWCNCMCVCAGKSVQIPSEMKLCIWKSARYHHGNMQFHWPQEAHCCYHLSTLLSIRTFLSAFSTLHVAFSVLIPDVLAAHRKAWSPARKQERFVARPTIFRLKFCAVKTIVRRTGSVMTATVYAWVTHPHNCGMLGCDYTAHIVVLTCTPFQRCSSNSTTAFGV